MPASNPPPEEPAWVQEGQQAYQRLRHELAKVLVGQEEVVQQVLVALLARGHALLQGVPGLAKSLLVSRLAQVLGLHYRRLSCTADLVPADVTGSGCGEPGPTGAGHGRFAAGPIFANLVLVDQIDQAPPRVQATILEAIEERVLVVEGQEHPLPSPSFLVATHNPQEENEGQLRAAQLDHFLLSIPVEYPSAGEEWAMVQRSHTGAEPPLTTVLPPAELLRLQEAVNRVTLDAGTLGYAWTLVRATRPTAAEAPEFVDRWIAWGAGPRGLLALVHAAKARALLHGRPQVNRDDVQSLAVPALRHRIVANPAAEANALTNERLVRMILESLPADGDYPPPPEAREFA